MGYCSLAIIGLHDPEHCRIIGAIRMEMESFEDDTLLDEVNGRKRKSVLSFLNKQKLGKHEMDDIFLMQ